MDDKIYTVTLADGTVLSDLKLNGNNFVSKEEIDISIFDGNCHTVTINDGGTEPMTYHNMECIQVMEINGEYYFILRVLSTEELEKKKVQSDIEYIALMCDVEL